MRNWPGIAFADFGGVVCCTVVAARAAPAMSASRGPATAVAARVVDAPIARAATTVARPGVPTGRPFRATTRRASRASPVADDVGPLAIAFVSSRACGTLREMTPRADATHHLPEPARLRRVRQRIDRESAPPLDVEAPARDVRLSAGHPSPPSPSFWSPGRRPRRHRFRAPGGGRDEGQGNLRRHPSGRARSRGSLRAASGGRGRVRPGADGSAVRRPRPRGPGSRRQSPPHRGDAGNVQVSEHPARV